MRVFVSRACRVLGTIRLLTAVLVWLMCAGLLVCSVRADAQGASRGQDFLQGVTVDAITGAPLRRARVTVVAGSKELASVLTNDRGEFRAVVPEAGAVTVRATKARYAFTRVDLTAAQRRAGEPLRVEMARGGVLTGRIIDPNGNLPTLIPPLGVYRLDDPNGRRVVQIEPDVVPTTYRLGGLPAGRYVVGPMQTGGNGQAMPTLTADAIVTINVGGPLHVHARVVEVEPETETVVDIVLERDPTEAPRVRLEGAAVSGRVVDTTGQPVAGATVTVRGSNGSSTYPTTADEHGSFTVRGVRPGTASVSAFKIGYLRSERRETVPGMPGEPITISEGRDVSGVEIVLARASTIEGIVVDEAGEPLEAVNVHVRRLTPTASSGLLPSPPVRTDDRGLFRFPGVQQGRYLLTAILAPEAGTGDPADAREAYVPMYYPGTPDVAGAVPLQVTRGEDVRGVVLAVRRVPVVRVEGRVLTSAGAPYSGTVRLAPRARGIALDSRQATTGANGEFAFDDVPAGEYLVQAVPIQRIGGPSSNEFGGGPLTVGERRADPIVIRTTSGSRLSGRVRLEGGFEGQSLWGYSLRASAVDYAPMSTGQSSVFTPIASGTPFSLERLAGTMRLLVSSPDDQWYLESVVINGVDATDQPFDFGYDGREYTDVEVVFSRSPAVIAGRAVDERANPVRDYAAIVFPADPARWLPGSRWLKLARSNANGDFEVKGLPPGDYFMVAVDRIDGTAETGEWQDPELLQALSLDARRVSVGKGERHVTSLQVVRR